MTGYCTFIDIDADPRAVLLISCPADTAVNCPAVTGAVAGYFCSIYITCSRYCVTGYCIAVAQLRGTVYYRVSAVVNSRTICITMVVLTVERAFITGFRAVLRTIAAVFARRVRLLTFRAADLAGFIAIFTGGRSVVFSVITFLNPERTVLVAVAASYSKSGTEGVAVSVVSVVRSVVALLFAVLSTVSASFPESGTFRIAVTVLPVVNSAVAELRAVLSAVTASYR